MPPHHGWRCATAPTSQQPATNYPWSAATSLSTRSTWYALQKQQQPFHPPAQFRRLERAGLSPQQAQALSDEIRELLCVTKEKIQDSCASKAVLRESILEQEARIAGFKSEVLKSQELSAATFSRDTERLQSSLDKIKTEVRYEIDKLTASQRLDLNLEKGRMRDELQAVRDKASEMEVKVDKDINGLKAMIEQTKNELFRYFMGMLIGLLGVGLGLARMLF